MYTAGGDYLPQRKILELQVTVSFSTRFSRRESLSNPGHSGTITDNG